MLIDGGTNPGKITEGKNGHFTLRGLSAMAKMLLTTKPAGCLLLSEMAEKVKKKRGTRSATVSRKLGRTAADKEARDIMKQPPYREAISKHMDVAVHYQNGQTDTVYMAFSRIFLKIPNS